MSQPDFQLFSSLRYDPLLLPLARNTDMWEESNGTDIKFFSPFYMASYHRDRMLSAAQHFSWTEAASIIQGYDGFSFMLRKLHEAINMEIEKSPLRVRTLLSHDGTVTVEKFPALEVSRWALYPERLPPPRTSQQELKVSPLTGGALTLGADDNVHGDPPRDGPWEVMPDTQRTTPSPFTSFKTTSRDIYMSARERVGIKDMAEKKEVLIVSVSGEIMEGSLTTIYLFRNGRWVTPPESSGGQIGTTRRWALRRGWCVEEIINVESLVEGEECWISNGVRGFQIGKIELESGK